ncbi:hypothetical protein LRP67_17880 [Nocardioides sp. cx-169]|uniref:hypothetical protein n=1 Tax=Nocardioides sp. cx-169 TaxID=2899080 RepID=UPI001E2FDA0B|nr:hypothetical protein [Nocardioides sp. cx-169]MCD4535962.1 hypothetical protein [Nocardioides sp. cx-169]
MPAVRQPSTTSRPWYRRAPAVLFTAGITAFMCAGAAWTAVTEPEGRVAMVALALFGGSVSWMMLLSLGGGRERWSPDRLDARPAWRLRLGAPGAAPAVALVLTAAALGLGFGALSYRDRLTHAAVPAVLAVGLLLLAVQMWQVWLRAPSFLLSADRLVYDGAGVLVELAWEDIGVVDYAHLGTRWAAVRISAATGAPSYRHRTRRSILPVDRVPPQPGIELRLGLLPDAPALVRLLRELHVGGRAAREATLSRGLPGDCGY